jgi:hypothetical protein
MTDIAAIATIPSALQSATSALHRSIKAVSQDASVVAQSSDVLSGDATTALIDSRQQVLYANAAARLYSASDEITQSLIDIRA